MAVLNTRIKLRNDLISNWTGSTTLIQKGEVALGYDDSKYVIKIGTTDAGTAWDDLPENLTIPAANVVGLKDYRLVEDSTSAGTFKLQYTTDGSVWTDVPGGSVSLAFTGTYNKTTNPIALKDYVDTQVAGATTQYFEGIRSITYDDNGVETSRETDTEVITRVTTGKTIKGGSTFVIKTPLNGADKYEYIAFTYDTTTDANSPIWRAMDGNYDATNVYLTKDILLAGSYTSVGNFKKSSTTATKVQETKGKSIATILEEMLSEDTDPSTASNPSVSLTFKNGSTNITSAKSYEAGTTITPGWSLTFNAGSYTAFAGQVATGVTSTGYTVRLLKDNAQSQTSSNSSGSFGDIVLTDKEVYKVDAKSTYSDGVYAKTALGKTSTHKITAGTTSTVTSHTITSYRNMYAKGTTATTLTSAIIRSLKSQSASTKPTSSSPFTFTATGGDTQVVFAWPKNRGWSNPVFQIKVGDWDTMANGDDGFHSIGTIDVADSRGTNEDGTLNGAMEYELWAYVPPAPLAAALTDFRVYFK